MSSERESPTVEWMAKMRAAFQNAISEDDMRELAKKLMERAKNGDREALRLVLTYAMPLPTQTTEHRRLTLQGQIPKPKALPYRNGRVKNVDLIADANDDAE